LITTDVDNIEYVWSPTYIDAMIVRDRDNDADSEGTPDTRVYVQHDANFNTTALVQEVSANTWKVVERYVYDPYAKATVLWGQNGGGGGSQDDWDTKAGTTYDFRQRFQGLRYDGTGDGMYSVRFRDYSVGQSRWVQQDPAGYVDEANLYQFVSGAPASRRDPSGLYWGLLLWGWSEMKYQPPRVDEWSPPSQMSDDDLSWFIALHEHADPRDRPNERFNQWQQLVAEKIRRDAEDKKRNDPRKKA